MSEMVFVAMYATFFRLVIQTHRRSRNPHDGFLQNLNRHGISNLSLELSCFLPDPSEDFCSSPVSLFCLRMDVRDEMIHPLRAVTPPVQSQHVKQHKSHRLTTTWKPRHCKFLPTTFPVTLPTISFPRLQTAQCPRPEENFQPLSGIVILPSWLPQHFDGLRSRHQLRWPRDLIFIFFIFEQQYFPGFVPDLCGPSALPPLFFTSLAP